MCASGNYKKNSIPKEEDFIPTAKKAEQSNDQMWNELMKLKE
jgi:hypothetical protein